MNFTDFTFNDHLIQAITKCSFTTPTPIQQQAILPILERRDLLGLAQTGTGKTAAFILPMVQHLMQTPASSVRTLIIAPTRELAEQINDFTRKIIRNTGLRSISIYGGVGKQPQVAKLRNGVDIVVACPGRLLDILQDGEINLSRVDTLILDEADHMFDKGFLPDIRRILNRLPKERQTLVFSATMPQEIRHLTENILTNPVKVQINPTRSVQSISHRLYPVEQSQKTDLLIHLLKDEAMAATLVFTRTKHRAKNLARKLAQSGFKTTSLQGNLSQSKRQQALAGFKDGSFNVLVATDIAARGIDVDGISHVINYDMPDTAEAYIHRTGRTGRAARSGDALSFATKEDNRMVQLIEQSIDHRMKRLQAGGLRDSRSVTCSTPTESGQPSDRNQSTGKTRTRSTGRRKANKPKATASIPKTTSNVFGLSARAS